MTLRSSRTLPGQSWAMSAAMRVLGQHGPLGPGRREPGEEVLAQERDVLAALAQGRRRDRHDVEPEVEILAELALLDLAAQILAGRRDDAQVDLDRLVAADAAELALLEHAQELGLEIERQLAELVEEHGAVRLASSNAPWRAATAPVNAPFSWPNSSLSISVPATAPQSTTMNGCSRRGDSCVQGPRDHVLAGAGLALDQHRGVGRRDALDQAEDLAHRDATARPSRRAPPSRTAGSRCAPRTA